MAEPAEQPAPANPACHIDIPVRLSALPAPSGGARPIALPDRPTISCRLAGAFAGWVAAVAPELGSRHGTALVAIATGPGFECRGRNRQAGAKISAHGQGLAIDVAEFLFADRGRLAVASAGSDEGFAHARAKACEVFTTVLGPGSDRFHANHMHVDLQPHGRDGRYRICQ